MARTQRAKQRWTHMQGMQGPSVHAQTPNVCRLPGDRAVSEHFMEPETIHSMQISCVRRRPSVRMHAVSYMVCWVFLYSLASVLRAPRRVCLTLVCACTAGGSS